MDRVHFTVSKPPVHEVLYYLSSGSGYEVPKILDDHQQLMKDILSLGYKKPEYTKICNWLEKGGENYSLQKLKKMYEKLKSLFPLYDVKEPCDFLQFIPFNTWISPTDALEVLRELSKTDSFKYTIELPKRDDIKTIKKELKKFFKISYKSTKYEQFNILRILKVEDLVKK